MRITGRTGLCPRRTPNRKARWGESDEQWQSGKFGAARWSARPRDDRRRRGPGAPNGAVVVDQHAVRAEGGAELTSRPHHDLDGCVRSASTRSVTTVCHTLDRDSDGARCPRRPPWGRTGHGEPAPVGRAIVRIVTLRLCCHVGSDTSLQKRVEEGGEVEVPSAVELMRRRRHRHRARYACSRIATRCCAETTPRGVGRVPPCRCCR